MLPRAAFRALRSRPAPTNLPRAYPAASSWQSLRLYSDNNNRSSHKPGQNHTWRPNDPIRFKEKDVRNTPSSNPVHPKQQPEFDAASTPQRNTAPKSQPGPGTSEAANLDAGAQKDSYKKDDLSGPQSPEDNANPATESPDQAQKPLPDLRQGIPSTFGAEFGGGEAEGRVKAHHPINITENPEKEPAGHGSGASRESGELPKSAYETSVDRRRNRVANYGYISALLFGVVGAVYMGRDWETEEERSLHPDAPSGWGIGQIYNRARARLDSQMGYYTEPTFPKLLPDMDPAPPLTLVLSLEDLLVHSEWTTKNGWRMAKRPGVDYFLRYLSQYYELVIFTSVRSTDADPIIRKLDPFRIVMWPLFREATRYEKGEYVKDLSCLNRDLAKTIIIDTDPAHVKLQPENAIVLPKWKGQPGDKGLVALIPFLEYLAMMGMSDVRTALKSFEGKDIPTEFARREAEWRKAFNKQLEEERARKPKHSAGGMMMGALGIKPQQPSGMALGDQGLEPGKMLIDQFRERGQKQYEMMEKEIRENGEKWLKEMADEEKRFQEEQMKNMKSGMFGFFGQQQQPEPKK